MASLEGERESEEEHPRKGLRQTENREPAIGDGKFFIYYRRVVEGILT